MTRLRRPGMAWLLVAALLAAQALGQAHRILHLGHGSPAAAAVAVAVADGPFGEHGAGSVACHLLDEALQGDALTPAAAGLPALRPVEVDFADRLPASIAAEVHAPPARGPPGGVRGA